MSVCTDRILLAQSDATAMRMASRVLHLRLTIPYFR